MAGNIRYVLCMVLALSVFSCCAISGCAKKEAAKRETTKKEAAKGAEKAVQSGTKEPADKMNAEKNPKDRLARENQLYEMTSLRINEGVDSFEAYAVTDLDRNGRLELLVSSWDDFGAEDSYMYEMNGAGTDFVKCGERETNYESSDPMEETFDRIRHVGCFRGKSQKKEMQTGGKKGAVVRTGRQGISV